MPCWAFCPVSLQKIAIFLTIMEAHSEAMHLFLFKEVQTNSMSLQVFFPSSYFFYSSGILHTMTSTEIFYSLDKVAGCWYSFSNTELLTVAHDLAQFVEHAVGPEWDIDRDLCSSQLSEGLGIQDE